jgi:NAD(P)-dependent dehydrogenase (short-subunit alcohol dehydrogenase family)
MSVGNTGAASVALVIGAAGKVGSAVARRLARDGFIVAGVDAGDSDSALPLTADPVDGVAMVHAASRAAAELGPIEVMVTGLGDRAGVEFTTLDSAAWRRLINSHLRAVTNACRAVLPAMLAMGRGTIVTLAPQAGLVGGGPSMAYEAAAGGTIIGFTKSLAVEMAPHGIRVNCVTAAPDDVGVAVADTVAFLVREGDFYVGQVFTPAEETGVRDER